MTTGAQQESRTDLPLPEQDFVDAAYERLDALRASYRKRQGRVHSTHGVGNAQAWTEREALSAHLGEMAARLEGVEERLVFGRLDMVDSSTRHVGRLSLSHEDGTPLLVEWRAPAARPFYQATSAKPEGVVRRRHISTRDRRVTGLEDELLDASHAQGLELQGEGALMHALSEARDGRMGDIVATIQSEQDRIIRASDKGLLVVQGGPGTGKTAVALHRIAYLLYAHRERLERSGVLLVGPSRLFLRYIEQVLPSLGETGVVSVTMGDLVPGVRARASEDEAVARIKGLPAWAAIVKEAVRALAKLPKGDQELRVWNRTVTLTRGDVEAARRRAKRSGRPHNVARESFARELMDVLALRLAREAGDADSEGRVEPEVKRSWLIEIRDSVDCRRAINTAWMPTSAQTLLRRLYARPEVLAARGRRCAPTSWPSWCGRARRPGRSRTLRSWTSARSCSAPCRPRRLPRRRRTGASSSALVPPSRGRTWEAASSPRRCSPNTPRSRSRGRPWPSVRPRIARGPTATSWSTRPRSSPPWRGAPCCAAVPRGPSRSSVTWISAAALSVPPRGRRRWGPRPALLPPSTP